MNKVIMLLLYMILVSILLFADGMIDQEMEMLSSFFDGQSYTIIDDRFFTSNGYELKMATNSIYGLDKVFDRAIVYQILDDEISVHLTLLNRKFKDSMNEIIFDFSYSIDREDGFSGFFSYSERPESLDGLEFYGEIFSPERYQTEPIYIDWDPAIERFIRYEVDFGKM
jgi:hypothetical protein